MDECARGVFFGSVYAGAVIWPDNVPIEPPVSIKSWDSKRISAKKREVLFEYIKDNCADWAVGIANSKEIDENNLVELSSPTGTDSKEFGKAALKHLIGVATYNYSQKKSLTRGNNFS